MESKQVKMKAVYAITETDRNGVKKSFWTRIGVGFVNQDGSVTLSLELLPAQGQKLQVREWEPYDPQRAQNGDGRAAAEHRNAPGSSSSRRFGTPPPLPREDGSASLDAQLFGGAP